MRNKLLTFISNLILDRPWLVLGIAAAVTAVSIIISSLFLQMNTDQDDLVSEKLAYHKLYKDYLREFGDQEYLYVVVENDDNLPTAKNFIKKLAANLSTIKEVKEVTYQVSNPKLEKSFLLYLPKEQIKTIGEYLPKMEKIKRVDDVFGMMNKMMPTSTAANDRALMETGFRFLDNLLDGLTDAAKDGAPYKPFMQEAFFNSDRAYDEDGFLLSENGKLLFVMIMPEKNYKTLAVIEAPLKKIRSVLHETKKEFPGISAGLTGRPVLAADEMSISDKDMTLATIAALFIVGLIFVIYFKRPTRPAMAVVALICGIAQTFGFATIAIGHLNILSIVFAVILIGAGIEFGLQLVSRYREELADHKNVRLAIYTCITQTGKGNITACLTTAAAFYSMCFTNFLALKELGLIAGTGIILCLINLFTILPALIYVRDRNKPADKLQTTLRIRLDKFAWIYARPKGVLIFFILLSIAAGGWLFKVGFNHNLLDLQAKGLESVKFEKKILEESSQSTWYAPFIVDSLDKSKEVAEKLKALPSVGKVETISEIVPDDQDQKISLIKNFKSNGEAVQSGNLATELKKFQDNISRLNEMAFSAGETEAVTELEKVSNKAKNLIQLTIGHEARIAAYEASFIKDLKHQIELLKSGLHPEKIELADMPDSIKQRFVSLKSGRFALYAYPKDDVWDPEKMEIFIKDLRSVDPNVTGTPVEVYESSQLLEKSFRLAAILATLAIVLIVVIDFRNIKLSLLALMPLALGILWLLELMGLLGVKFNLANFFGIPILLGVGVDNAVQIVHRYKKDHHVESVSSFMTRATGIAVLLTSLTTLASFGTMIFARHQGIASLGIIMSLGTITCFIGSMIMLPCALILLKPKV